MTKHFGHHVHFNLDNNSVVKTTAVFPTGFNELKQIEKLCLGLHAAKKLNTWAEIFTDIEIQPN